MLLSACIPRPASDQLADRRRVETLNVWVPKLTWQIVSVWGGPASLAQPSPAGDRWSAVAAMGWSISSRCTSCAAS
jgi:hypothetical protein